MYGLWNWCSMTSLSSFERVVASFFRIEKVLKESSLLSSSWASEGMNFIQVIISLLTFALIPKAFSPEEVFTVRSEKPSFFFVWGAFGNWKPVLWSLASILSLVSVHRYMRYWGLLHSFYLKVRREWVVTYGLYRWRYWCLISHCTCVVCGRSKLVAADSEWAACLALQIERGLKKCFRFLTTLRTVFGWSASIRVMRLRHSWFSIS